MADAGTVLYGAERIVCLRLCNIGQVGAQKPDCPAMGLSKQPRSVRQRCLIL